MDGRLEQRHQRRVGGQGDDALLRGRQTRLDVLRRTPRQELDITLRLVPDLVEAALAGEQRGAAGHAEAEEHHAQQVHLEGRTPTPARSEEHTSELQSLMRISYAVFCFKKKTIHHKNNITPQ